jgi:glycerate 2-kinase
MTREWIQNTSIIATSHKRKDAIAIINAGLSAIDTKEVLTKAVSLEGDMLRIGEQWFDLTRYRSVNIIGFGKVICGAVPVLEHILGDRLRRGVVIGIDAAVCQVVDAFQGTHPMPSHINVQASEKIVELSKDLKENDLVIVIVSGGGSSLLCWPQQECEQGARLYQDFLKVGGTIRELNTVRKHISSIKGGGLMKYLYPAQVVGLIFSDIPGGAYEDIASGPTYRDTTTVADARAVLDKYHLSGYTLNETPKDEKYFKNSINIPLISNEDALMAMKKHAESIGYEATIVSSALYGTPDDIARTFMRHIQEKRHSRVSRLAFIAGGEPRVIVPHDHGKGGRNQLMALSMLRHMKDEREVFVSIGSDGRDNGDMAGAIVDLTTKARAQVLGLDIHKAIEHCDAYPFLKAVRDHVETGATDANVSDLMLLLS